MKLEPQSDTIIFVLFLLLINLCSTLINESESSDSTNFKCISFVNIHSNKQAHLFSPERCYLMNIGPKKLTPVFVNVGF